MEFIRKYAKTASFAAGSLSVLGFAPTYCFLAPVVGFSVLMFLLLNAATLKKSFGIGYSFGFAHFAFGFSWIGNALLIEPEKFGWLYPFVFIGAGGFFGLFFAVPAMGCFWGRQPWQKWLIFCAGTVVFEWVRSFIFTGFPWNLIGYTLAFSDEMIQAASFGGTYLLSLVAVIGYSSFGLWLNKCCLKNFGKTVAIFILMFVSLWVAGKFRLSGKIETDGETLVRIVQPSIPQQVKWNRKLLEDNFDIYLALTASKAEQVPDLIVWGETASPFMLDVDEEHLQKLVQVMPEKSVLVTGMVTYRPVDGRYLPHNSMVVINSDGQILDYYHKSHLVPFGEYIPFRKYLPEFIQPVANAIGNFGKGNGPKRISIKGFPSLGGLICYETIFPNQVVDKTQRPDFIVNLTNDGWYGNSAGPYQHWAAAKLRAVEEGIAVIRAANNGISGLINEYGEEKYILPLNHKGISDFKLGKPFVHTTVYSLFGNSMILTFCLLLIFLGAIRIRNEKTQAE